MELFALMSLAIVAGVVSFGSPCMLPLLPGYLSFVSGLPGGLDGTTPHAAARRQTLTGAGLFVLGFTTVFTSLGLAAAAFGSVLAARLPAINLIGGAVIIAMGLALTGLLRVPVLQRQLRLDPSRFVAGPRGALPLGAAFAIGWTPCVGPVLASILATAAGTATLGRGALLLSAYAAGLGVPFLLLAAALANGRAKFGWLRRHGRPLEIGGGMLLVVMGTAMATGGWTVLMSRLLAQFARLGWPPL